MVPIEKKKNATDCGDFRTIILIPHVSKIVLDILKKILTAAARNYIGKDQYGFKKGCGTRDAIAILRLLIEWNEEHNQDIGL